MAKRAFDLAKAITSLEEHSSGPVFRFERDAHEYFINDVRITSTSELLERSGEVDDTHYTVEGADRGHAVHLLTCDYDLGAIDDHRAVESVHKGYLAAHVKARSVIRPEWHHIEEAICSFTHRYGTRPDREGLVYHAHALVDIKTGGKQDWHGIQLALQAIASEEAYHVPATAYRRYVLYLRENGGYKLDEFVNTRRDFGKAYDIIRKYAR